MKSINLNTEEGVKVLVYPDGQPHVNVQDVNEGEEVRVICSITDTKTLLLLLQTSNALDNLFAQKTQLVIPYLMGARFDRLMQSGDSIDLVVIANLINSMNFSKVYIYDVHSETSTVLIKNSINISNHGLVKKYDKENSVLICPDAGAVKKVDKYLDWNLKIKEVVFCIKSRDLSNGKLSIKVLEPEKCKDRNCVIIDDICDGGGTFLGIADQIAPASLTLIVTHGIFSQGYFFLEKKFDKIITSDSYPHSTHDKIETVSWMNI